VIDGNLALLGGRPAQRWLVTGAAGFIGSNLVETLLRGGQFVTGLDNFATGHRRNLDEVRRLVGDEAWSRLRFIDGDIRDPAVCRDAVGLAGGAAAGPVDHVLHQAALGSVPRSIAQPMPSFAANVEGFLQVLEAARAAGVRRFVYASSSSVYGDHPDLPKVEDRVGRALSPYAATKAADELFAETWSSVYGIECAGLRYFNVFGPRQDPDGAYAAVIPRWAAQLLAGRAVGINGDGETTRDFCYVDNVVQANLLAATTEREDARGEVFNVAVGGRMSLNALHAALADLVRAARPGIVLPPPHYRAFREGDVRHSQADIGKIARVLGYAPTHDLRAGLAASLPWYDANAVREAAAARAADD